METQWILALNFGLVAHGSGENVETVRKMILGLIRYLKGKKTVKGDE